MRKTALATARHALGTARLLRSARESTRAAAEAASSARAAQAVGAQAELEAAATALQVERGRTAALAAMRARLIEALTAFKREALLGARSSAAQVTGSLASISTARMQVRVWAGACADTL
jgi:hypothetical protein